MAVPIDWQPYLETGLLGGLGPEHDERRELLSFLIGEGCTIEEMVAADERGRLFGLAGDRVLRPGARRHTLAEVAELTRGDEQLVRRLWRSFGLAGWDSEASLASPDDVQVIREAVVAVRVLGEEAALAYFRAIGAALSRIGEASNALGRSLSPAGSVATSASELETARYWAGIAPMLPSTGRMLDVFFRHHFELAREHFERSNSFDLMSRRRTRAAVGFVDMSGFTRATEELDDAAFARLMESFAQLAGETVSDLGGRVVKLIGDAAMVVAPDPPVLVNAVDELLSRWSHSQAGYTLHAGLAYGELLCQDGDFFGRAVNIAARLVAVAGPETMLASAAVGEALTGPEWLVEWQEPADLRGMAEPIVTCVVRRSATAP
jgi:class 3 adenylate cyclase